MEHLKKAFLIDEGELMKHKEIIKTIYQRAEDLGIHYDLFSQDFNEGELESLGIGITK